MIAFYGMNTEEHASERRATKEATIGNKKYRILNDFGISGKIERWEDGTTVERPESKNLVA